MLAICIESSHQRGLGHLFRCLNFVRELEKRNERYLVLLNPDERSEKILRENQVLFQTVDLWDFKSGWEQEQIRRYGITLWLNDRMGTDKRSSKFIKTLGVKLCTIDDTGNGAQLCDLNIVPIPTPGVQYEGRKVLCGAKYIVLNTEIDRYRRTRTTLGRVVVSLGGSDTYGVTVRVAACLKELGQEADFVLGPAFSHEKELRNLLTGDKHYRILRQIPSLPALFSRYDIAITGGGVTPFEAAAAGLPCVIVANEPHEKIFAQFLEKKGCAIFVGDYSSLSSQSLAQAFSQIELPQMSLKGQEQLHTGGASLVMEAVLETQAVSSSQKN